MAKDDYDFKLRVVVDSSFIEANKEKSHHIFGWYRGEDVRLMIEDRQSILEIKLDKDTGNVSIRRSSK